jgi:fibronectin type 3 domain-containing protein
MVHKAFKKAFKAVTKPLRTLRVFKFLQNINPWVALGIFAVGWLFMRSRKPDTPDYGTTDFDTTEKGILVNKQSNNASIPVVYGERLIGGTRVFISTSGTDNIYLYVALVLCEGEINSIEEIRVDDKVVTFDGALSDNVQRNVASSDSNFFKADPNVQGSSAESTIIIEPHFGTDGQSASSLLSTLSDWGTNHKLSGICYLALRFKWNPDVFGGIPTVQAKIKGKKIVSYNSSLVAQTPAFSTNPAFCLLDYLTNERYGKGLAISSINLQSFYDASQVCVTQVTPYSGASDINIFDCNAVIDTSKRVIDNVREIIKGMRGYLPFVQGKYRLNIETTGSASISLDEDDIIGGYALASPSKNSKYNRVIVSFVNPARNFQVDEIQFPPIDDSGLTSADRHSTMKSADGGFLLEGRFEFRTITSPYQAEEMAEIILRRSREALGLNINVGFEAFDLHVGDLVNITLTSLGFSNKTFRVLSMTFNEDFTIGLSLIEYQASHYTWATKTVVASTPATNLPNPFTIQAPASVTLSDEMIEYADGVVLTRLNILIGASSDAFVQYYQVEAKLSTESNFKIISNGQQLRHELLNVIDDATYDVRVKAINSFGVSSSYTSASRKIIGATEIPSDVDDLSVSMVGSNQMELSWTPVQDLDISWYEIRFQNVTSGATWNESTPIAKVVRRKSNAVTLNAQVGSYCIKAVDKLGNSSANASIVSTNISGLQNFTNVLTLSE